MASKDYRTKVRDRQLTTKARAPNPDDGRKDFYTLTEKGLDLIPIVLNIVLWSAQHDAKSYVRGSKEFLVRLSQTP